MKNNAKNKAQMILMAGIMISVLVIALATMTGNLANIGVDLSLKRSTSPLDEYINVRDVFIKTFNDTCAGRTDKTIVWSALNYTKRTLFDIEIKRGNYFDADLQRISYYGTDKVEAVVLIELICQKTHIEENIRIPLE